MKILITEPVIKSAVQKLQNHFEVTIGNRGEFDNVDALKAASQDFDGFLTMLSNPLTRDVFKAATKLKVVSNYAVGYNNIDLDAAREFGVRIANTPGVLTESTAEIALSLLLSVARHTTEAEKQVRNRQFNGWHPTGFLGLELFGATLGIIGMGRIGQAFARKAHACGMKILYHNRNQIDQAREEKLQARYMPDLDRMLEEIDALSIHCPLTDETRHLIDRRRINLMKNHVVIVNTSRGPVIDEDALADALKQGQVGGAGLDVYEHEPTIHPELYNTPNTVLLPHIGSATVKSRRAMGDLSADAIIGVLTGKPEHTIPNLLT
ncbi:MAG: D-glycerate dehydrogenase [Balneolaceae bacterium]